jgi:hypothetical protein
MASDWLHTDSSTKREVERGTNRLKSEIGEADRGIETIQERGVGRVGEREIDECRNADHGEIQGKGAVEEADERYGIVAGQLGIVDRDGRAGNEVRSKDGDGAPRLLETVGRAKLSGRQMEGLSV